MAIKTSVSGNRVTIDDSGYDVRPAGAGKHAVFDEFGGKLGHFVLRGKTIEPEDFGVAGSHPVAQIAKLWAAANLSSADDKGAPGSKMVCRVATHDRPAPADLEKARAYQAWLKKQPGVKAAYVAHDPSSGKALSISVWESRERLSALKSPADGPAAPTAASVEVLPLLVDACSERWRPASSPCTRRSSSSAGTA